MIRRKRIYLAPAPEDGVRILVEPLWPRGLKKEEAAVDLSSLGVGTQAKACGYKKRQGLYPDDISGRQHQASKF